MAWINFTNFTGNSATFPGDYLVGYIGTQEQRYPVVALKNGLSAGLFTAQNLLVTEDTTIRGNLSVLGSQSVFETIVSVTSALSVINVGTGPALTVKQTGTEPIALFLDDSNNTFRIDDNFKVSFFNSQATGQYSVAEGYNNIASGFGSHAEGENSISSSRGSHAEGYATATGRRNMYTSYTAATKTFTFAPSVSANFAYVVPGIILGGFDGSALSNYFKITVAGRDTVTGAITATTDVIGGNSIDGYLIDNSGDYGHAEGEVTTASGYASHAEGVNTVASGYASHAEGINIKASGDYSHAAGSYAAAANDRSWIWKGSTNTAVLSTTRTDQFVVSAAGGLFLNNAVGIGTDSIANALTVVGNISADGNLSVSNNFITGPRSGIVGRTSSAENTSIVVGDNSHAEGFYSGVLLSNGSHAEGTFSYAGLRCMYSSYTAATRTLSFTPTVSARIDNYATVTAGTSAILYSTTPARFEPVVIESRDLVNGSIVLTRDVVGSNASSGNGFLVLRSNNSGFSVHAEGYYAEATGAYSHAEGDDCWAHGQAAHAEGSNTVAEGICSHAEGSLTTAFGFVSHAEGINTIASGYASHAEGVNTIASGAYSHAQGYNNVASGLYSHAAGSYAAAANDWSWVWKGSTNNATTSSTRTGQFMVSASGGLFLNNAVGIGTDSIANALTVVGNISADGNLTVNGNTVLGDASTDQTTINAFTVANASRNFVAGANTFTIGMSSSEAIASNKNLFVFDGVNFPSQPFRTVFSDGGNFRTVTDSTMIFGTNSDQHLRFRAGGSTSNEIRMTILSSGEVGIGTTIAQTRSPVVSAINGNFQDTTGLTPHDANWYYGTPNGWTSPISPAFYTVWNNGGGDFVANPASLASGPGNSSFRQNLGPLQVVSDIRVTFDYASVSIAPWSSGTLNVAIYDGSFNVLATNVYTTAGTYSLNAVAVPAGTTIIVGFWATGITTPGLNNVTVTQIDKNNLTIVGSISASGNVSAKNIYTDGKLIVDGNVGVGTETPNERLTVMGTISGTRNLSVSNNFITGSRSRVVGSTSSAENTSIVVGNNSHTEGFYSGVIGNGSHAEGTSSYAGLRCSYTSYTAATRTLSFTPTVSARIDNYATYAAGTSAILYSTTPLRFEPVVIESRDLVNGSIILTADVVGVNISLGTRFLVLPGDFGANLYSHAEGYNAEATGEFSHAEGNDCWAHGQGAHAEGSNTVAEGICSHAEGSLTTASGPVSHAEGGSTISRGFYSHSEGFETVADGGVDLFQGCAHSEGFRTSATGTASHAEGGNTTASGAYSHAQGYNNVASGQYSHAAGAYAAAAHDRTWIWRGSTATDIISTTRTDQFMVSASGGLFLNNAVGINTDSVANALTVVGNISATGSITASNFTGNTPYTVTFTPFTSGSVGTGPGGTLFFPAALSGTIPSSELSSRFVNNKGAIDGVLFFANDGAVNAKQYTLEFAKDAAFTLQKTSIYLRAGGETSNSIMRPINGSFVNGRIVMPSANATQPWGTNGPLIEYPYTAGDSIFYRIGFAYPTVSENMGLSAGYIRITP